MRHSPSRILTGSVLLASSALVSADAVVQSTDYESGALGAGPSQSFVSSSAQPALWNFQQPINDSISSELSEGLIFVAPRGTAATQAGGCIYNQTGELVWSSAASGYQQTMQYAVQQYKGQSVITIWQGSFNAAGYGSGHNLLLDSQYKVIGNVTAADLGTGADIHEFRISPNNTGLVTAYIEESRNLTEYGLDTGNILNCVAQEIDIETGAALFTWKSLDHVQPSECYVSLGSTGGEGEEPWDYFHINSIEKDAKGNFLISSRHCKAVYYVDGSNGDILWRLGGMNSNFTMGKGTDFQFQHDARWRGSNGSMVSIFDNAATGWESDAAYARGILLNLDYSNMTATLATEYLPYNRTVSESQGNVHITANGNAIVGYGQTPQFAEYDKSGNLLWSAQYGVGDVQGYRVFRFPWSGYPTTSPNMTIFNTTTAFVSWNGATEVAMWQLFGSNDGNSTTSVANVTKSTFETALTLPGDANYTYYQVAAMNAAGSHLGWSNFVANNGSTLSPNTQEGAEVTVTAASSTSTMGSATGSASAGASSSASVSQSGAAQTVASIGVSAVTILLGLTMLLL